MIGGAREHPGPVEQRIDVAEGAERSIGYGGARTRCEEVGDSTLRRISDRANALA